MTQEKATPKQIQEYNDLVNRGNKEKILKAEDANRVLYIESLMSSEQKKDVVDREFKIFQAPLEQEKATPEMVAEYNELANHYKENGLSREDVKSDAFKRMKYIYGLMTPEQRKSAEDFPPPPAPVSSAKEKKRAVIIQERQKVEEKRAERRERDQEKRERDMVRREREKERAERREIIIERRGATGDTPPPPPPPPAPPVPAVGGENSMPMPADVAIPAPPPPPSPEEAIQGWIEEGATFYYNGKKVSGEEALKRVQKNDGKHLNVQVRENDSEKVVRIRDNEK